jgi:hypothetical protein
MQKMIISVAPRSIYMPFLAQILWLIVGQATISAQNVNCTATTLPDFFLCYGGQSAFGVHSVAAITTFMEADSALKAGNYAQAKTKIDNLFNTYPRGNNVWWNVFDDPNGANVGTPHSYYGLRMLEDIIDYKLSGPSTIQPKKAKMKIVMVGCSEGILPNTKTDLQGGTGTFVKHDFDTRVADNDYRVIKQSLELFTQYVTAITKGALAVEVEFVTLPTLCLPVAVTTTQPYLAYSGIDPVWNTLDQATKDSTDWWWILYPSHVPNLPAFDNETFITGGMGSDYKGGPVFISDDRWLIDKPAHLGKGKLSDVERRIYMPQWLQHEFFHHLYRIYPELELEVDGHDWFNRNFWPADFVGQFESDYYTETLHKRLQTNCTPLATKLITRPQGDLTALYSAFSMDEMVGKYARDVVQNPWHEASIIEQNGEYYWRNTANVQWKLTPNLTKGRLETGSDSPYPGQDFFLELHRTTDGDYVPGTIGLKYNNETYRKKFGLIRQRAPIEIVLGEFERVPNRNAQHTGNILKTAGQFKWQNNTATGWSLLLNTSDEYFRLGADSPTPNEKFEIVFIETDCDIYALGFKYLGHYYWKPKRSTSNGSPKLVKPIADLQLIKQFGTNSINTDGMFEDPEGDSLLLFVTSESPTVVSADITTNQLIIKEGTTGNSSIYIMALDANGGLAVDSFRVQVNQSSSTHEPTPQITVHPRLTQDDVYVHGATAYSTIILYSMDQSYQQTIPVADQSMRINLGHLPAGMYFLVFANTTGGSKEVIKVIKY